MKKSVKSQALRMEEEEKEGPKGHKKGCCGMHSKDHDGHPKGCCHEKMG